jgi:pimeloyl-ACP methyl ester carboxylesterase
MGGSISSYYVGTRPDRVAGLALLEGLGPPDLMGSEGPTRTAAWIDAWRGARDRGKTLPSIEDAARRLMRHDERLGEDMARRLAVVGTRAVEGGVAWKMDPLHSTIGPYPYRLDSARKYWERITCPVVCLDGAQSKLNLGDAERAARRAVFADVVHVMVEDAGHALQRHQPGRVADAIVDLHRRGRT